MNNNKKQNLIAIIANDMLQYNKLPLLLLIAVLVSAIMVTIVTYQTRLLISEREQATLKKVALDVEWRNLVLEEKVLGDHHRIEFLATNKLQMQYVDILQENIITQPQ